MLGVVEDHAPVDPVPKIWGVSEVSDPACCTAGFPGRVQSQLVPLPVVPLWLKLNARTYDLGRGTATQEHVSSESPLGEQETDKMKVSSEMVQTSHACPVILKTLLLVLI